MERGTIEVAPLAFMRGRTLNDAFIILDEAQNTTPEQMKMFLTRIGFGLASGGHRRRHADRPPAQQHVRPRRSAGGRLRNPRHRRRPLRQDRRRAPPARPAHRGCLRRARPPHRRKPALTGTATGTSGREHLSPSAAASARAAKWMTQFREAVRKQLEILLAANLVWSAAFVRRRRAAVREPALRNDLPAIGGRRDRAVRRPRGRTTSTCRTTWRSWSAAPPRGR